MIAKFDEIVKIGGCTQLISGNASLCTPRDIAPYNAYSQ